MVVLAASIVTKSGKAVISRQFREMQRSRIEGLLASFPKLTGSDQQHTTIETEHVRYVYQPLEELYLVLITNRQSNILEDIESLHLFARVVTDICRSCDEHSILQNAFELLYTFDEIISNGYRENVNLSQVKNIIQMESHEERIQDIIAKNKEKEANEERKRKAKQFEMQKKEAQRLGQGFMQGNYSPNSNMGGRYSPAIETTVQSSATETVSYGVRSSTPPSSSARGMQLGRKPKTSNLLDAIKTEVEEPSLASTNAGRKQEGNTVLIEERVSVSATRDGGLEQMEIRGVLALRISDAASARISLALKSGEDLDIIFKTHPNVDKTVFKDKQVIQMRDTSRPFPVNQNLELVRWKVATRDETAVPLSISCWPSPAANGTCDVNVEYELEANHLELRNVVISIPLPADLNPTVNHVDGLYEVDHQRRTLDWKLPVINSSNKAGLLECNVSGTNEDGFFPVSVTFVGERLISDVDVTEAFNFETNGPAQISKQVLLIADEYTVG